MDLSPEYTLFAKSMVGLLAIVNPLGAIPIFLSLSGERSPAERQRIARVTAISVATILIISSWAGDFVLGSFGIAVVPLAIPLLAGPGAISLVIVDAHQALLFKEE